MGYVKLFRKVPKGTRGILAQMVTVKVDSVLRSLPEALDYLQDRTLEAVTTANGSIEAAEAYLEQLLAELDWYEGD